MEYKDWKETSKGYKIGYIIGLSIPFSMGLLGALSMKIESLRISSLIFNILILIYIIIIKKKKGDNNS